VQVEKDLIWLEAVWEVMVPEIGGDNGEVVGICTMRR